MATNTLSVSPMIQHWLNCPVGTYLGSSYGNPAIDALQKPLADFDADAFIAKLISDIPVLQSLPADSVSLYSSDNGVDKMSLILVVANDEYEVANA